MRSKSSARWKTDDAPPLRVASLVAALCILAAPSLAAEPAAGSAAAANEAARAAGLELFQNEVRLVLAHNCVTCHGGDLIESEFDLTTRESLLAGGKQGPAVKPGDAENSRLVKLITHELDPKMPEDADKLSDAQIAAIVRWIELGAPYDKPLIDKDSPASDWTTKQIADEDRTYWAFQPLADAAPPPVQNEAASATTIDRFVSAALSAKGIAPAGEADKRTLLRRAYLDLHGIPPTPEEAREFLSDERPDAFERLIDRLLASSRYGERWARHWLDVARFAESHGFEQDYDRPHAYHYRDFVIRALNDDMPYDRFVRWQLAGDELAPENPQAMMATGFLGAGVFPTQITANEVERTRYDALDDMVATTGSALLGLTVGCARCHDHKFDPIPQADYYRLVSVFTTTVRSNVPIDLEPEKYRAAKAEFDARHAPLAEEQLRYEREKLPERLKQWEEQRTAADLPRWLLLDVTESKSAGGATFEKQPDGSLVVGGASAANDVFTFVARTNQQTIRGIKLEALAHPSLVKGGPGRGANGNFCLTDFELSVAPADGSTTPSAVKLKFVASTFDQAGLPAAAAVDDNRQSGWAVDPEFGKNHAAAFELEQPLGFPGGTILTFTLRFNNNTQHAIGRPRLSLTSAEGPIELDGTSAAEDVAQVIAIRRDERTADQQQKLLDWFKQTDPTWQEINARVQASLATAPKPNVTQVMICSEGVTPIRHHTQGADFFPESYFLTRGNAEHKVRPAEPGYLQVLMRSGGPERWHTTPPAGAKTSFRRTALAKWITDTEHGAGHLLARVIANRLWHHHFGRGIVATPNDFGAQAPLPTHPELLDYLARRLITSGWSLKALHKEIMTSAVYRRASTFSEASFAADPNNSLLWRWTPRRLEGEAIRDAMLAVSGALDPRMYGPGSLDEGHDRRSIYFTIKRSVLIPTLQLFDAPEPLASIGQRPSTTVAPQALLFMNNRHVRRWALKFAEQLPPASDTPWAEAVAEAYARTLARDPSAEELADATAFLTEQAAAYDSAGKSSSRSLALADFCQALFSTSEFLYVP